MAHIPEKSPFFRTREILCRDLAAVLKSKHLHKGTKKAVIDNALWAWSEFDGKYEGCPFKSADAQKSDAERQGLIHEHLVPRKIVREKLFKLKNLTADSVRALLRRWCIGVVITKAEDDRLNELKLGASMPSDWNGRDRNARYRAAKIIITPIGIDK